MSAKSKKRGEARRRRVVKRLWDESSHVKGQGQALGACKQHRSCHKSSTQPKPRQKRGPSATACEVVSAAHSLNHGLKELERDCGTERGDTPLGRWRTRSGVLGKRFLDPRPVRCRCHCTRIWLAYYEKSDEICKMELLDSAMYFSQQHDGAEV